MKILVTGVKGQLGYDIVREANNAGIIAIGVDKNDMDITDEFQVRQIITDGNFDAVVHCAAWTAVDKAEEMKKETWLVNVQGTINIANICELLDIPLLYFSTDYVFNGQGTTPWNENDKCQPINVYGQTKYEGELVVEKLKKYFIIRISWVFGKNGNNFIKTMLKLGKENAYVNVVSDQVGSPTYTHDLSKLVLKMIVTDKYGVYHATNEGFCSWYDFACEIFKLAKIDTKVIPILSSDYQVKAQRPKNSIMNKSKLDKNGFSRLPSWQDALKRYLIEIG